MNHLGLLYYGAKSISECAFYQSISQKYGSKTQFYFSELGEYILPKKVLQEQPLGTHVYLCTSHDLSQDFITEAKNLGYPNSAIHREIFGTAKKRYKKSFTTVLSKSQTEITVTKDQTLLEALETAKIPIKYSCRAGGCGSCEVKVLAGDIQHLDSYYSIEEKASQNRLLACVSRAQSSKIIIDL